MRVTDNTSRNAVQDAVGRNRARIEDLQLKNATLKKLVAPSDDPVANSKILDIRTETSVNKQFEMNAHTAKERLESTEGAIQEVSDLLMRAKEIALNQASGASATPESRAGVAQEVTQIYQQLVSIANRRVGSAYIFSGYKTNTAPYSKNGDFKGDLGQIPLEIQKGVFIATNLPGPVLFRARRFLPENIADAEMKNQETEEQIISAAQKKQNREPAGNPEVTDGQGFGQQKSVDPAEIIDIFRVIESLRVGLLTNDTETIRGTIESIDTTLENSISLRSKIGARVMGINSALSSTDRMNFQNAVVQSNLEDADYAEIWASLAKEESVLRASLSAAQKLIQPTLLDYIK